MSISRLAFLALLVLCPSWADRIDDLIRGEMEQQHIPGLALAILRDGEPPRLQGFGFANLEHNVPVTPRSVFKLASVSKHFFAAAILLLADEGKISLNDPVRKYIDDAPPAWDGVTIRHLLSHTGGLVRECPAFNAFKLIPDADLVRSAFVKPLEFAPGAKYQYSNVGYFTTAEIIRRLSGKPWDEFITDRIFRPVGMHATRATTTSRLVPNRTGGYDWNGTTYLNAEDYIAVRPSGAFLSTIEDLAKWDAALSTDIPLNKKAREKMWRDVGLNDGAPAGYGLGWSVADRKGRHVVHHGGSLPGFRTHYARFPAEKLSVIVLANSTTARASEIVWKIAAEFLPGFE